jgi:hypothetical protein
MKKIFLPATIIIAVSVTLIVACKKEVESRTDNIASLNPVNIDLNAGIWKPILLTGPTEFAVPAPIATTSPDYIAQVNEIKTWQADLTSEEKRIVKYFKRAGC